MTAYNVRFGCNFFGTKTYGMDRVGCGEDDRGNNNIQKDKRSLLTYMRRCRSAHCNDLAVYGLQIHMYVEKMRYHEIYQNKPNQVNYSFFDIYRTNLIQHNNQPIYGINVWWLFRVENHFIKCYGCDLLFCTYKIR